MKKLIIALMILVSVSSSVFAAVSVGSWSTQTNGNVVGSDSAASLKAAFTINKDSIADQVTIGFTSSDLSSGIDVADNIENILSEGVVLSDNDGDGRASNEGKTVNVFFLSRNTRTQTPSSAPDYKYYAHQISIYSLRLSLYK